MLWSARFLLLSQFANQLFVLTVKTFKMSVKIVLKVSRKVNMSASIKSAFTRREIEINEMKLWLDGIRLNALPVCQ